MSGMYIFEKYPLPEYAGHGYYEANFEWYFESAMKVLEGRSEAEIATLVWDIDEAATRRNAMYPDRRLTYEEVVGEYDRCLYPGRTQSIIIQHAMAKGDLPATISNLPGLTWVECISGALLGHVMFAYRIEKELEGVDFKKTPEADFFYDMGEFLGEFAICCQELLGLLSAMPGHNVYSLPHRALSQKKISNAQEAANARHAHARKIKGSFINWYLENESVGIFHSQSQAAEKYLDLHMNKEEKAHVSTSNTLIRALRAHKKDQK